MCSHVSSFETKYGKLNIEEIAVTPDEWGKYGLSNVPAIKIGSRLLTREEFISKETFEKILLEETGIVAPVPTAD